MIPARSSHPGRARLVVAAAMTLVLSTGGCASFRNQLRPARDFQTAPESEANSWSPVNTHVEVTGSAPGYYLASTKRRPTEAIGADRRYLLVNVGNSNPLLTWTTLPSNAPNPQNADAPYAPCRPRSEPAPNVSRCPLTVTLATPVAFNLFWDAFTDDAPIVDTDYTFGLDLSARISPAAGHEDRLRAYWGHISTHIGDEYFNAARRASGFFFPRINPSYWPWRLGASHRAYFGAPTGSFRRFAEIGGQLEGSCLFGCGPTGYYSVDSTQTDGQTIPMIKDGVESHLTADLRWYVGKPKNDNLGAERRPNSINLAALIGRRRVFPYAPTTPGPDFERMTNLIAGYTWSKGEAGYPAQIELYMRWYNGPNPYGQLRNQRSFNFTALGMRFR